MTRRRAYVPRKPVRLENPELFPAWVFVQPPAAFDAINLRGGLAFEAIAAAGFRVQVVPAGASERVGFYPPWTYLYLPVPAEDCRGWVEGLPYHCSVIMDCHFPIMDMETAMGSDQALIDVIDNKDTLLANLACADVVTVPKESWAADLAEVNPNVFLLPDMEPGSEQAFIMRLAEVAAASVQVKAARWRARGEMGL